MTNNPSHEIAETASLSTLARTTVAALAVAAVVLVVAVLPAEYGIDPLGIGRWLGLTNISAPPPAPVDTPQIEGATPTPVSKGPLVQYPGPFKFDVYEVVLQPYEFVEYKYRLEQGATMAYSWTASAPVRHDFHGEREERGADGRPVAESYDTEDRKKADGSFTAPFAGIHGWFWDNTGEEPVRVRLVSSGFYSAAIEFRSDRTQTTHTLRTLETLTPVGGAADGAGRP